LAVHLSHHRRGQALVPVFGQSVPILEDPEASPEKGTGAVMCCTFGDAADVAWWYKHDLPLRVAIGTDGRMTEPAGEYAGMTVSEARGAVLKTLEESGHVRARTRITQSVRVHERDDTPVEYIVTRQWFIRVLEAREDLLARGEEIAWHPPQMKARYREWVENLGWDWCISRQRYYGVPFPVWYCDACGEPVVADSRDLPVDPTTSEPPRPCPCGAAGFTPERDVMDTWATSSMTPQTVAGWLTEPALYHRLFPLTVHPQSHEIIRTWAFYSIVKSHYQFGSVPWRNILISGWGRAPEGAAKISKSRGGGPLSPVDMLSRYSADAVRYWAASAGPGKDSVISEEKIAAGAKLVTKLWNVAGFSSRFLDGYVPGAEPTSLSAADRWILLRLRQVVTEATRAFECYDYAAAKNVTETFFWRDVSGNYLEMAKKRLYDDGHDRHEAARYTLQRVVLTTLKLFAPVLPFVTEAIYRELFADVGGPMSIHSSRWPEEHEEPVDDRLDEEVGKVLLDVAGAIRRYKSERGLSLGASLDRLQVEATDDRVVKALRSGLDDLASVTRAAIVEIVPRVEGLDVLEVGDGVGVGVS